jgi:hypothetical protein
MSQPASKALDQRQTFHSPLGGDAFGGPRERVDVAQRAYDSRKAREKDPVFRDRSTSP